jgi:hypothetical protein
MFYTPERNNKRCGWLEKIIVMGQFFKDSKKKKLLSCPSAGPKWFLDRSKYFSQTKKL